MFECKCKSERIKGRFCQFLRALKTGCIFQGKGATPRHSLRIALALGESLPTAILSQVLGDAKPPGTCLGGVEDTFGDCWSLKPAGVP